MKPQAKDDRPYMFACNRCNLMRPAGTHPCVACANPEFRIVYLEAPSEPQPRQPLPGQLEMFGEEPS